MFVKYTLNIAFSPGRPKRRAWVASLLKVLLREGETGSGFEESLESTGGFLRRELDRHDEAPGNEVPGLQRLTCIVRGQSGGEVRRAANVMPGGVFPAADDVDDATLSHGTG